MLPHDLRRAASLRLGTGELAATVAFAVAYLVLRGRFSSGDQLALGTAVRPLLLKDVRAGRGPDRSEGPR